MSTATSLTGLVLVAGLAACAAPPMVVEAPVIEESVAETPVVVLEEAEVAPEPATFSVTFGGPELSAMKMVMEPGEGDRQVRLVDGDTTLTGVAEAIGEDRWLVGVAGVASDACIVIRMTAEREGAALRGWAVVDTEGRASSLPFVAEPTS